MEMKQLMAMLGMLLGGNSGSGSNSSIGGLPPTREIANPGDGGDPVTGGFPGPSGGRFPIRIGPNLPGPNPGFPNEPMPGAQQGGMMKRQPVGGTMSLSRLFR